MGKIVFLFSGQGAQAPGMGKELTEVSAAAKKVFDTADAIRPGTSEMCFHGTQEELSITINTQPALFCADLAAAEALREAGIQPDYCAGFSLGELAALTFAGSMTAEEGFQLVCRRAELMQKAGTDHPGAMAAVLKLSNDAVESICAEVGGDLWPVNYNCPGQVSVAGSKEKIAELSPAVTAKKGRCVPLAVSGAFHSPYMQSAADGLREYLADKTLKTPEIPVYANLTAAPYGETVAETLAAQCCNPVRWQQTLEALRAEGVDTFVEVGCGKTLAGLVKKTFSDVRIFNVENAETLKAAIDALK